MYHPQSPVTSTLTAITVEKAIAAIETAADEIPADDFISYSTILDVHLSYALEFFNREEQAKLLQALEKTLKTHDELAKNIAWDLVSVLLPFLDAPPQTEATVAGAAFLSDTLTEIASTCLFLAAYKGSPREVFLKILQALSSLSFTSSSASSPDEEEPEEFPLTPTTPHRTPNEARENGYRKLRLLIMLLTTIHSRITTAFPSRFLSQSLTTLLRTFTRSVESLNKEDVEDIISRLLVFVDSVQPAKSKRQRRMTQPRLGVDGRPTLPPRSSTAGVGGIQQIPDIAKLELINDEDAEAKEARLEKEEKEKIEEDLQIRLLQSFVSHIVEVYILRCPSEYARSPVQSAARLEPPTPSGASPSRGINLHLASNYLKKNRFLSGGKIDSEKSVLTATPSPTVWKEILDMAYQLSISTKELQELSISPEVEEDVEEPRTPIGTLGATPRYAEDIPLSKNGSLILLASRIFEQESIIPAKLRLFPEHSKIVYKYLGKGSGPQDIGILDAVLFLGAWALAEGGGFGDTPQETEVGEEGWLMYLQTFALLSATSTSPLTRLLTHDLLEKTIHSHPDEAARLAYIKDTLEHCPFESLKASIIGILKDEISAATSAEAGDKPSLFASPLLLDELSQFLFPNLSDILDQESDSAAAEEAKWDWFIENYAVILATSSLWYFLLKREYQGHKGVCGIEGWGERIEGRWLGKLRAWLDDVAADEELQEQIKKRGLDADVDIARCSFDMVDEVRKEVAAASA